MKEIKAFVKPFKVNDILNQLLMAGYPNITVSLAEGTGKFKSDESTLSTYFSITDSKVAKIEIVCNDIDVDQIVNLISIKGRTGNPGDGLIYVSDIQKVIRVRTGLETEE
ncbi:MAG: P-II family nitrogen regulator [Dysgonamonadaceae bacterium]|nr:P-II family nitrogen regulator [Dysgonamonadaceae bacterium]MDD3309893.1 P-II family nitrogen regulator [Dysgonamonadaceae bacterium]MDD3901158.1 P-II family nitrogen regulator [Dysgonamonadaceae bacterium]MDD4399480.1 P-II family nitrogen regulator [Dysgonamonadaceae bacterium]MEA5082294.1 P-II family nitrogen regulator [Dysgonamonadaceae bacterium]